MTVVEGHQCDECDSYSLQVYKASGRMYPPNPKTGWFVCKSGDPVGGAGVLLWFCSRACVIKYMERQ